MKSQAALWLLVYFLEVVRQRLKGDSVQNYWEKYVELAREKRRKRNLRNSKLWENSEILFNPKNCASKEKWIKAIKDKMIEIL